MPETIQFTLSDIARTLDLSPRYWTTKIKNALYRLCAARYEATNCFHGEKKEKLWFSLFDAGWMKEEKGIPRIIELRFSPEIKKNIDADYYQWLDFDLYKRIKSGLPRRLYEYLQKRKYQLKDVPISEKKLCRWLPVMDKNITLRRNRLEQLAQELIRVDYLSEYNFDRTKKHCNFTYASKKQPGEPRPLAPVHDQAPESATQAKNSQRKQGSNTQGTEAVAWLQTIPYLRKNAKIQIAQMPNFLERYPAIRVEYERQRDKIERPAGWVRRAFTEGWQHTKTQKEEQQEQRKELEKKKVKICKQIDQAKYYDGKRIVIKDNNAIVLDTKPEVAVRIEDINPELLKKNNALR